MSDRKKIIYAIVGSLILHVIIILGSSRVIALWPEVSPPEKKVDETPPQLTMLDTQPPAEQKQERQYLRTNDDQKTDQKPADSMFESDKDTAAASEQPAKGDAPLPTQNGKETPDIGFKDEQFSLADRGQAFSTDPGRQTLAQPQQREEAKAIETPTPTPVPTPTAAPTPTPALTPTPTPKSTAAPVPTPPPASTPTPTSTPTPPAPAPLSTPSPAPTPNAVPSDEELAMLRPPPNLAGTPSPTATPSPPALPSPTATPEDVVPSEEELAMLRPAPTPIPTPSRRVQTRPQRPSAPATAYRQEQRMTRMQGNINNRGRSSIAALGTPQGRFEKAVQDAVGSRWYYYVRERGDLINIGTVQIRFYVRPDGKVEDVKVLRNSSNETLASTSLQSIIEADIPPMPEDLAPMLSGDRMEFTMSFNFTY
jgi:TonB family protein